MIHYDIKIEIVVNNRLEQISPLLLPRIFIQNWDPNDQINAKQSACIIQQKLARLEMALFIGLRKKEHLQLFLDLWPNFSHMVISKNCLTRMIHILLTILLTKELWNLTRKC